VFAKTQAYAQKLNEIIRKEGFPSVACHRGLQQSERIKVYEDFKKC
jgi:superfamily II DNA/RNA helicase